MFEPVVFTVYQSSKEGVPLQLSTRSEHKALRKMKEHPMNTVQAVWLDTEPCYWESYLLVEDFEERWIK